MNHVFKSLKVSTDRYHAASIYGPWELDLSFFYMPLALLYGAEVKSAILSTF